MKEVVIPVAIIQGASRAEEIFSIHVPVFPGISRFFYQNGKIFRSKTLFRLKIRQGKFFGLYLNDIARAFYRMGNRGLVSEPEVLGGSVFEVAVI